ncbi:Hypothetical protein LUCI_0791 [Lucifera butyrica]|uniref:Uncharacterized protein n=1 Tax=Lucifera butyrica TaxID=1351585 RepID=A0A498R2G0_9FIRM|nr:hypothetical protein [Lucifera butyrica]VBB05581.1 Hypothetical protein LUCI_0791 [Lucifera butyrica]
MCKTNGCSGKNRQDLLITHEIALIEGIAESKAKYRKVVQAGIAKWVGDFQKGLIEIKTIDDLKKLVELDLELQRDEL